MNTPTMPTTLPPSTPPMITELPPMAVQSKSDLYLGMDYPTPTLATAGLNSTSDKFDDWMRFNLSKPLTPDGYAPLTKWSNASAYSLDADTDNHRNRLVRYIHDKKLKTLNMGEANSLRPKEVLPRLAYQAALYVMALVQNGIIDFTHDVNVDYPLLQVMGSRQRRFAQRENESFDDWVYRLMAVRDSAYDKAQEVLAMAMSNVMPFITSASQTPTADDLDDLGRLGKTRPVTLQNEYFFRYTLLLEYGLTTIFNSLPHWLFAIHHNTFPQINGLEYCGIHQTGTTSFSDIVQGSVTKDAHYSIHSLLEGIMLLEAEHKRPKRVKVLERDGLYFRPAGQEDITLPHHSGLVPDTFNDVRGYYINILKYQFRHTGLRKLANGADLFDPRTGAGNNLNIVAHYNNMATISALWLTESAQPRGMSGSPTNPVYRQVRSVTTARPGVTSFNIFAMLQYLDKLNKPIKPIKIKRLATKSVSASFGMLSTGCATHTQMEYRIRYLTTDAVMPVQGKYGSIYSTSPRYAKLRTYQKSLNARLQQMSLASLHALNIKPRYEVAQVSLFDNHELDTNVVPDEAPLFAVYTLFKQKTYQRQDLKLDKERNTFLSQLLKVRHLADTNITENILNSCKRFAGVDDLSVKQTLDFIRSKIK